MWIVFAGLAILPFQMAAAQEQPNWTAVDSSASGDKFYALASELQPAAISMSEPQVWVKQTPSPTRGLGWHEGHALYKVNCAQQSYSILKVTLFFADGTSQSHEGEGVVRRIVPQTSLATLAGRVCPAPAAAAGHVAAASAGPLQL